MLMRVVRRTRRAKLLDHVIVATSDLPGDNVIEELCIQHEVSCFRGSETDVLDRFYRAALSLSADLVIRITADCPLIEPQIIDRIFSEYVQLQPAVDYASNTLDTRTFPRGLDCEVIRFEALETAWKQDKNPEWREHVTPYIYRNPELFACRSVTHHEDLSGHRWTVDTREDFELIRKIYRHYGHDRFTWREVLDLIDSEPALQGINRHVRQKVVA